MPKLSYPPAPTSDQVDDYHGTTVADPYRPLEDTDAPATRDWIAAQNAMTEQVLSGLAARGEIRARLAELWDFPRAGAPIHRGDRWFQLRNTGLQDQDVLWVAEAPDAEGRVLLDPNVLSTDGTRALSALAISDDGERIACAISDAGSDWRTWSVREVGAGEDLADRVPWSKFASAAWTRDGAGFFYGRYPEPPPDAAYDAPNLGMELRYHRLGTDAADDPLVLAEPEHPDWGFEPTVTDDGRLLVISVWRGTDPENRLWVADLTGGVEGIVVRRLLDTPDARYEPIGAVDGTLYLLTDRAAPNGRVVSLDVATQATQAPELRELVAERDDAIEQVHLVGNRLAVLTLHDAHHRLAIHELDGTVVTEVALPAIGTVGEMTGRREDDELFVTFLTFAAPASVLAVRMADGTVRTVARPSLAWDPDAYVTEQAFVTSDDGTRVPLFLTHRRDVAPDGDVPSLLYGYGGFQVPIGPMFKPEWLAWMERGGLLAVASLRGGAEYGKAWHDAGRLANKQNAFDDFAACARWLAESGWTRPARIGILGRSNGGLLVGASVTQRPELFGAAVAEVGVMDMLRFHRFTIGWGWTSDYGSADDPEQFGWLRAYSPLHNVRPGVAYPPTLVTTGDHDDRVVPGHSFKFAAALQAAQGGEGPVLIRIDTDAGHGVGKPVSKLIDERADVLAFLELALRA
ncbi:MAG TPA: prolyl oligopeptidase family serine peptidase [Candidatus Limnocylindria bacterium]|nr:prolyl oligopeptidase family serine peptidase [Candidatus Limnocylindria bacterium]